MTNTGCPHTDLIFQHDKDLYRGNGKPGLTIRMQQLEDRMTNLENYIEKTLERREKKTNVILGCVVSTFLAVVVKLVFNLP